MKKIVFTYGIIAGILIVGISALIFVVLGSEFEHVNNEMFGYLVMILGLSLIFVATKKYRDKHLGGVIKFKTALLFGIYISLVAGTIYVANWELYMQTSEDSSEFIVNYQQSIIDDMQSAGATEEEINAQKDKHEEFAKMYENVFIRILITYSEILPVGLLISLISAFLLKNSEFMPSHE